MSNAPALAPIMAPTHAYDAKTTSIHFSWPDGLSGLERIMLAAQGDLQRLLSAFFARPILVSLVYSLNERRVTAGGSLEPLSLPNQDALSNASTDHPIIQRRQVHLQCAGKTVCTATSTVQISSPQCAQLFLKDKYAIGQMFQKLGQLPQFELLQVGFGAGEDGSTNGAPLSDVVRSKKEELWRKYRLGMPGFECEILEEFPSREMFEEGESWLST